MPRARLARTLSLVAATAALSASLVGASPAAAADLVVDNTDKGVQVKGTWTTTTTTGGFYGSDYAFRTPGDGSSSVTWPFPDSAPAGKYEVSARWSAGENRATNATYQVSFNGGTNGVPVNQKGNGGAWQSLGTLDFSPGKKQGVTLTDNANGVVVADAIRWVGPIGGPAPQMVAVVNTPGPGASTPAPAPVAKPAATPAPAAPAPASSPAPDARYFDQTRYRIADDAFWDYFQHRGNVRTFGYPVSNTFTLFGLKTQIFQRQIMQQRPDGGVQTMNLLDEGLLPYTKMNGSQFPAADPDVMKQAPKVGDSDYHERALQFVRDMAPDEFDGSQVGFARTFFNAVRPEDAFPDGVPDGMQGILSGFNLEVWGLPTSKPTYDPSNRNFIYQRFQRGIMHYDKGCNCTQGLLLADYVKAIMLNRDLPSDLAQQAKGSKLLGQWAPAQGTALARPQDLPGSNLQGAFRRDPTVTIDPGHGAQEIGTSHTFPDGTVLQEKMLNLRVATRLGELLKQAGYDVQLTRTTDAPANADKKDLTGDGKVNVSDDLQARVDVANRARSDVLVSVHFNGVADPDMKGTYIFWDPDRPFSDKNKSLAEMVNTALVKSMQDAGYTPVNKGARTDKSVLDGAHYYLLSPKTDIVARPSEMPAIIGEALFLTNDDDANAVRKDAVVEAIARGYLDGIKAYFAKYPPN